MLLKFWDQRWLDKYFSERVKFQIILVLETRWQLAIETESVAEN